MPNGPHGQWRPAGAGALATHVCRIATGEIEETYAPPRTKSGNTVASQRASVAGKARSAAMTADQRSALGKAGSAARWQTRSK
jgi:hypothetical protein